MIGKPRQSPSAAQSKTLRGNLWQLVNMITCRVSLSQKSVTCRRTYGDTWWGSWTWRFTFLTITARHIVCLTALPLLHWRLYANLTPCSLPSGGVTWPYTCPCYHNSCGGALALVQIVFPYASWCCALSVILLALSPHMLSPCCLGSCLLISIISSSYLSWVVLLHL